jgi:hypothetical protein
MAFAQSQNLAATIDRLRHATSVPNEVSEVRSKIDCVVGEI